MDYGQLYHNRMPEPLKTQLVTAPAIEPVTYSELATFLKLASDDESDMVKTLEVACREYVEEKTRYTLITTTYNLWLDWFPSTVYIPARPLQAVNFIKWTDQTGTVQTLDPTRYLVDLYGPRPTVIPPLGNFFPIAKVQTPNAVQIQYTAGFGSTAANVPEKFKLCIKQMVLRNWENRSGVVMGRQPMEVPHTFGYLLNSCSLPEV